MWPESTQIKCPIERVGQAGRGRQVRRKGRQDEDQHCVKLESAHSHSDVQGHFPGASPRSGEEPLLHTP